MSGLPVSTGDGAAPAVLSAVDEIGGETWSATSDVTRELRI